MATIDANVADAVMGTVCVYRSARWPSTSIMPLIIPHYSISLSLNIILTLMIVVRLVLHARDTRTAMGKTGLGGLYKAIVTILAESCALFAVNSLLYLALSGAGNTVLYVFSPIVGQTQVCAFQDPDLRDRLLMRRRIGPGHRSTAHHSAGRQQERVDKRDLRLCAYQ